MIGIKRVLILSFAAAAAFGASTAQAQAYPSKPGIGDAKLERYGEAFIKEIKLYLDENPRISIPEVESRDSGCAVPIQKKKKGETVEETYEFFKGGMSLEDIAKLRSLAPSTIASHMERLILDGRAIDIDRLVDSGKRLKIQEFFLSVEGWNLNPVVEHFNGTVSYEDARLVRAHLHRNHDDARKRQ